MYLFGQPLVIEIPPEDVNAHMKVCGDLGIRFKLQYIAGKDVMVLRCTKWQAYQMGALTQLEIEIQRREIELRQLNPLNITS